MAVATSLPTTFADWVAQFEDWQRKVGFDTAWLGDYRFEAKYDADEVQRQVAAGHHGRGAAPRLADVPPADGALRARRRPRGAEAAAARRQRGQPHPRLLQRADEELARLLRLHAVRRPRRQVPAEDEEVE